MAQPTQPWARHGRPNHDRDRIEAKYTTHCAGTPDLDAQPVFPCV